MDSLAKTLIALGCVFSAALLGMSIHARVPDRYQGADSKDVVRLAMGLVVTTVALALGLLVGSAKAFYDTQNAEMAQLAANYIMLDRALIYYGPESAAARTDLRAVLANRLEAFRRSAPSEVYLAIRAGIPVGDALFADIQKLSPKDDNQRSMKDECLRMAIQLGQLRWLIYEQNTVPFPQMLLIMLVSWLVLLFGSFGLFAPRNPLVLSGIFASALAVCGAILLILTMYQPQRGLIRVSDAPLRAAMNVVGK